MAIGWKEYQEEAAAFFRSLGLDAETDVAVQGVRTSHDVDVLVKSRHVGFEVTWIVECKHWKSTVSKLHVLALREIVADVGADRGILLAEALYLPQANNLRKCATTSASPTGNPYSMTSYFKPTEQPIAADGGVGSLPMRQEDPFRVLDDLMAVVEALCPKWPERRAFEKTGDMRF